jgi:hypothetical protein
MATKVNCTWWGGVIGPRILNHVKCNQCGQTFNSKTGRSNTTGIIVYSVVTGVICLIILALFSLK